MQDVTPGAVILAVFMGKEFSDSDFDIQGHKLLAIS